jgi:hypothetical protein
MKINRWPDRMLIRASGILAALCQPCSHRSMAGSRGAGEADGPHSHCYSGYVPSSRATQECATRICASRQTS